MTVKPHSACFYRYNGKEARAEALCIQNAKAREIQIINEIKSERQKTNITRKSCEDFSFNTLIKITRKLIQHYMQLKLIEKNFCTDEFCKIF